LSAVGPTIYLVRHGETEWAATGRHTGRTDIPLTAAGEADARRIGERLRKIEFSHVFSSPLSRALRTCELAGYRDRAEILEDLLEWDYGRYEGLTTAEIRRERPDWQLFRDGCPGGESPQDVAVRADRLVQRLKGFSGNVLIFSSGHILRSLTVRWLGMYMIWGSRFVLGTNSISILGFDKTPDEPAVRLWNYRLEF
jgi:probable phosphoglycerate mutase